MLRKSMLILFGLLLLGFALRVFKLTTVPMYGDELTMVTDTYSLMYTGRDQTGQPWPVTFSMGSGRPAGYVYGSIPFVAIFGPTIWGVRGLSILSTLGIILVLFLLVRKLFSTQAGLWAAFLAAVSPWDLNLGRGGFEAHLALFLALWGTYLLLNIKFRKINLLWTVLVWGLAVNTYPTFKLILPLFLPVVVWYLGGLKVFFSGNKTITVISGVLAIGIIGLTLAQTFYNGSENRFKDINVFSTNQAAVEQDINFNRTIDTSSKLLAKVFYNRPLEYFRLLGDSYLENFSLEYLIISGDGNPRHNMATMGEVYTIELVTIVLGLKYLIDQKEKRKDVILLIAWLLIAPMAAIFTLENHSLRTNFMLPPLIIFSAVGVWRLWSFKKPILFWGIVVLWFIQFVPMLERTYFLAPNRYARFWSNLAMVISTQAAQKKTDFDYVILSTSIDNLEYAYPVYNRIPPGEIIANNQTKTKLKGYEFKKYANVYLGTIPEGNLNSFINSLPGKVLYIGPFTEGRFFSSYQVLYDRDKLPSAVIYEKKPL